MKRAVYICLVLTAILIPFNILAEEYCQVHTFDEYIFLPDCTKEGYTVYSCTECSYEYIADHLPPLGHDEVYTVMQEPTCKDFGVTDAVYCNICGEIMKDWQAILPLGHILNACSDENSEDLIDYVCERCGESIQRNSFEYLNAEIIRLLGNKTIEHELEETVSELREIYLITSNFDRGKIEHKELLLEFINIFDLYHMGDIDLNGKIDAKDLSVLLSVYGTKEKTSDIDKSGCVNADDLSLLLSNYTKEIG